MAIKYNIPKIANEVFENLKNNIKISQERDEAIEKQERQKEELTKQLQEQNLQQKLKEKEKHETRQIAINERLNAWLKKRENQIKSQISASKEKTPSPSNVASPSNSNNKEELLRLRKQVEIIKQINKEKEIAEKLKQQQEEKLNQQQEENLRQLKLKEKTRPVSTIENVDYYYQLRTPKREEKIKSHERHTISSDPKQTVITRIKLEGLEKNLQKNHSKNKEHDSIENQFTIETRSTEKGFKSCLKNSSISNKNTASDLKNIDEEILNSRNQSEETNPNQAFNNKKDSLGNIKKIHKQNLDNVKIAYDKHPFTKLLNKNGKTNEESKKPLNEISTPKIKYTDILEVFANKLKKSITK